MTTSPFQTRNLPAAPTGGPFAQKSTGRPASDKQLAFIASLLADRDVPATVTTEEKVDWMTERGILTTTVASSLIDSLKECPRKAAPAPVQETTAPAVEDGSYALEFDGQLRFFHVRSPETGKWSGFTFVDEKAGPEEYPVRDRARRTRILEAIAADDQALARYGQELGICGMCHRELTDEVSRAAGLGPICRNK